MRLLPAESFVGTLTKDQLRSIAETKIPNPKLGTVTNDVARIVGELKAGRVEYRADRYGICHVPIGKASFEDTQLVENYAALLEEILRVKPAASKGRYACGTVKRALP
jgi:large subunit ribosomal protein L1